MTGAVASGAPEGMDQVAVQGADLAQGAGEVIALRQNGNDALAAAEMEKLVPVFHDFRLRLEDATSRELARVSELRSSADRAGNVAEWLLVISGIAGSAVGLAISFLIARSSGRLHLLKEQLLPFRGAISGPERRWRGRVSCHAWDLRSMR